MKIKVLGTYYTVKFVQGENIEGFYGEIIHSKNLIRLSKNQTAERAKESLIHELVHAIDTALKLGLSEVLISRFSNVLNSIILDNPHIFRYDCKGKIPLWKDFIKVI